MVPQVMISITGMLLVMFFWGQIGQTPLDLLGNLASVSRYGSEIDGNSLDIGNLEDVVTIILGHT